MDCAHSDLLLPAPRIDEFVIYFVRKNLSFRIVRAMRKMSESGPSKTDLIIVASIATIASILAVAAILIILFLFTTRKTTSSVPPITSPTPSPTPTSTPSPPITSPTPSPTPTSTPSPPTTPITVTSFVISYDCTGAFCWGMITFTSTISGTLTQIYTNYSNGSKYCWASETGGMQISTGSNTAWLNDLVLCNHLSCNSPGQIVSLTFVINGTQYTVSVTPTVGNPLAQSPSSQSQIFIGGIC